MQAKISVIIICFDEERNIERCIKSVQPIADEIVVLDSFSSDRTAEICQKNGVRFVQHAFDGHIEQKNRAMSLAKYDMVLSLDADEALDETLQNSIAQAKENWQYKAYSFNRKTNYAGQWIMHCGWYPDTKLRLWNKNLGKWGGYNPHDKVEMQNNVGVAKLSGNILHYSFYSIAEHQEKIERYSSIKAKAVQKRGKSSNWFLVAFAPVYKFFWMYFIRLGFLDGYFGLIICLLSAKESALTYQKIRKLQQGKTI